MFILIKVVILSFLALVVFYVPLGSRPLAGHIRAIGATPESQELKQALTDNVLMLDTWIESHRALSGEPSGPGTPAMAPEKPIPPVKPQAQQAPPADGPPAAAMRRPRKSRGDKPRGDKP